MDKNTFVTTIDPALGKRMIKELAEQDFELSTPAYTVFQAKKKGVSCTLYTSGKLTVQGKDKQDFIEFYLEPEILKKFTYSYQDVGTEIDTTPRIGIDESGKGDFFGPLCVAGVFAEGDQIKRLREIGVKDSKTLSPAAILKIGKQIREEFVHHIVKINPEKYNVLIEQFGNLNKLLAWGHATTIEQLVERTHCKKVVVDQFANEHVVLTALKRKNLNLDVFQRHRAEEDLVVAAASILARCAFVDGLAKLEKEFNQDLPKGASKATIEAGKKLLREHGKENLGKAAKLHFKTLDSILGIRKE